MAIDFEMTPRQRKLKYDAREFAREVLRPTAERADAIGDPQAGLRRDEAGVRGRHRAGLRHLVPPREIRRGRREHRRHADRDRGARRRRRRLPDHPPRQRPRPDAADLVRHREAVRDVDRSRRRPREHGLPRRLGGQRAGRDGELRPPVPDGGHPARRPAGQGRRHARPERREALALQRGRLGPARGRRQPVHRADRPGEGRPGVAERRAGRARHPGHRVPGHRQGRPPDVPERHDDVPRRAGARGEPARAGRRRPRHQPQLHVVGADRRDRRRRRRPRGLRVRPEMGEDVHRRRDGADHQPPGRRLPARRDRREDRGVPVHVLEGRALHGHSTTTAATPSAG